MCYNEDDPDRSDDLRKKLLDDAHNEVLQLLNCSTIEKSDSTETDFTVNGASSEDMPSLFINASEREYGPTNEDNYISNDIKGVEPVVIKGQKCDFNEASSNIPSHTTCYLKPMTTGRQKVTVYEQFTNSTFKESQNSIMTDVLDIYESEGYTG